VGGKLRFTDGTTVDDTPRMLNLPPAKLAR
jgi:hypothetical protein